MNISKKSFLSRANSALRSGNYSEALEYFERARYQNPELKDIVDFNIRLINKKQVIKSKKKGQRYSHDDDQVIVSELATRTNRPAITPSADPYTINSQVTSVDIVVPVYNALEDVKLCLEAIKKNTDGFAVSVFVVNDASDSLTTDWLREFCRANTTFKLTENETNKGYTPAVNVGLGQCTADYIVTLNSDTIVTAGWLAGLVRCFKKNPEVGVAGPLSNAASWQNVPNLLDDNSQFAVNELPIGWSADDMSVLVRDVSQRVYPRVPFVNGFCFMIARAALDKIGLLDEATFPTGYGEENDYCIRIAQAGFSLAICDDTYVFHAKSKSFGHKQRKQLSKIGSDALKAKHGKENVNELAAQIRDMTIFSDIRQQVQNALTKAVNKPVKNPLLNTIMFLLPVSGGGGGVHSIVQETIGMRRIGVRAKIAVPKKHRPKFIEKYQDIDVVEDLFVGFELHELSELSRRFDVIVGTIYTSMRLVKEVVDANPGIQPAYYVQDYEPFFSEPGSPEWQEARDSYTLVPKAILFAKTDWICQKVYEEHGVQVRKVAPSIDHSVYMPDPRAKERAGLENKTVLSAMIRPKTPRRGAERTMRLLKRVSDHLGGQVQIEVFGCAEDDPLYRKLERDFEHNNHGELSRLGVAAVLQMSDCFVDLSDYQAFGRTGLEAMACGAFSALTNRGGIYEYAEHNSNAILVDVLDEAACFEALVKTLESASDIENLKRDALRTAAMFSIHSAAVSEVLTLSRNTHNPW